MKKFSLLTFLAILLTSAPAGAKMFELFVQPQTGGMFGLLSFEKLPWGDDERLLNQEEDYFMTHRGPNAGISMGLEFAFIDVVLDVNQFYRSERQSTLFNVMVGLDADFATSSDTVWTVFLFGGFGMGTIDNAWLEKEKPQIEKNDLFAQIFFLRAGFRYEYKFTELIRLSLEAGLGAHLLTIAYKAVNEDDAQSAGIHAFVQGGIRFYFDLFGKKESDDPKKDVSLPPKSDPDPKVDLSPKTTPPPPPAKTEQKKEAVTTPAAAIEPAKSTP